MSEIFDIREAREEIRRLKQQLDECSGDRKKTPKRFMHFERTGLEDTKGAVMVGTEVVTATEHDRIVAELKSELARLRNALEQFKNLPGIEDFYRLLVDEALHPAPEYKP